jgi:desulfoferrodoxin (superoxide reductase-like protein)
MRMKTFICQVCGHIAFEQAPVDCPVCSSAIENFENAPDVIKKPADPDALSETDRIHIPKIVIDKTCTLLHQRECITARVTVGENEHMMESEHFIHFMDFYIDQKYISRVLLTPKHSYPSADLHFHLTMGTLSVIAHCNVHGSWIGTAGLDLD